MTEETATNGAKTAPVSVVIPCFRCARTIARTVASVARQSLRPAEVIIIDDGSQDGIGEVLEGIGRDYAAGWIRPIVLPANRGPGNARNVGWEAAAHRYVAFLDADDTWHPQKIEIQYNWMEAHPQVALSGHECAVLGAGSVPALPGTWTVRPVSRRRILFSNCFSPISAMVRREVNVRFEPTMRYMEDYLWLAMSVYAGITPYVIQLPLAYLYKARFGTSGLSADLWEMEQGEVAAYWRLRELGHIGSGSAALLSAYSLLKYLRRLALVKLRRTR